MILIQKIEYSVLNSKQKSNMISDEEALDAVLCVVKRMHFRGNNESIACLTAEQKMLHMALYMSAKPSFDIQFHLTSFVQKINKIVMSRKADKDLSKVKENKEKMMNNQPESNRTLDLKLFSKAITLLFHPNLSFQEDKLRKLKILTFNNLGCFYKQLSKHNLALSSVNYALEIELQMLSKEKYDIVPTYLNKVAIYSDMGKHIKAIEQLNKIQRHLETIKGEEQQQESQRQKKRYGKYMRMLVLYNYGVENEHLKKIKLAAAYFEEARTIATQINNAFMVKKLTKILQEICG